ncbi:MAG TPA: FtsX-like permease family protein [Solirubrobacteraceae bacterium]|nr:FtsX-like permease family protein [Solirubrobacteraceae bacterium]
MRNPLNPRIAGVRLGMLAYLYGRRLRSHAVQELLAGCGIAVGVALVFGVLVANTSITGSAGEIVHQVVGSARLQLAARSSDGFAERQANTVAALPGVQIAAPVLRENIAIVGPRGRRSAQLLGVTGGVVALGSLGTRDFGRGGFRFAGGLILPASIAGAIHAEPGDTVTLLVAGVAHTINVGAVLDSSPFGALASSPVAITLLGVAQGLTGLPGRVTQVLVEPRPGEDRRVGAELRKLAQGRLDVEPADNELRLLGQATQPNNQSITLFSAISVMVGFLLALSAMLLTVPERRRFIADLRMQGYDRRQILLLLGFQALILGVAASLAGVALGDVLSRAFFHRVPTYLMTAFPIGTQQVVHLETVLLAFGCGVLATVLASLSPIFDLRASRPADAVFRDAMEGGEVLDLRTTLGLGIAGVALLVVVTLLVLIAPSLTILGGVALALATLCLIPAMFALLTRALPWASEQIHSSSLIVAVAELRATTTRSVAIAGIAGLAVYGSLAIGGARNDLIRGLDVNFSETLRTADLWVTTGSNDLATNSFHPDGAIAAIARAPGVVSVRAYQGSLLDVGARRLWIIARPSADSAMIPASQLLEGDLARATERLRQGGWTALSRGFADERRLRVGDYFELPTPSGDARLRVAAITTNLGWPPGAIVMNTSDYARDWQTNDPSALEVNLARGVTPPAGKRSVEEALGRRMGLRVQTLHERESQYAVNSRQGLQALSQISTLLLITAALAVASSLSAAIWQRRARLASLKIQGYDQRQLWRARERIPPGPRRSRWAPDRCF